jgi:hypothetical protein
MRTPQGEAPRQSKFTNEHFEHFFMQHRLDAPDEISRDCELDDVGGAGGQQAQTCDVARLPGSAAQLIGERIRAMYSTMVREPVPGHLLELIRQLENKEKSE